LWAIQNLRKVLLIYASTGYTASVISFNTPSEGGKNMAYTLPETPQWSDWHTADAGFADSPDAIECRNCRVIKPAVPANFRRKDYGLPFQTTCRRCEMLDPYRRTIAGRVALIRSDPSLPDAQKKHYIDLALDAKLRKERKSAAIRSARHDEFDLAFKAQWAAVRHIIVYRKECLLAVVHRSKNRGSGLFFHMANSRKVDTYIRVVLATYAAIIDRMRRLDEWRATIGDHLPPSAWAHSIQQCSSPLHKNLFASNGKKKALPFEHVMVVNPWLFTTKEERRMVNAADPAGEDPVCQYWQDALNPHRGPQGALLPHVYPWKYPDDGVRLDDMTPDWLRPFNGYEKPKGNP